MITTPNFDAIAEDILDYLASATPRRPHEHVVEHLKLVWNARGAADIALLETQLAQQMGATASGPYTKNLDRALRALDR